ncbi:MAG: hypothetical protein IM561_09040 [Microcystis sp. M60BS1]|uniref:hypothetical protein n=1 Tax=unclassified Microcystis TaxID=2643300 RepID=UPI00257F1E95|nr:MULTISPECIES: hypothetical protein [unclassified Microcystis]MCA2594363.1 hypothetical protein [Microcystis sp. M38BS1]MCA6581513.1 hypothetical protein [Pseudanabaena sp. M34BS1SP1A06MG]MCA2510514.1 hypothetical protein [Microcystis sp. M60BS1]MCA2555748.1 hypothetical protein [Microcystis sp. M43BS1]MCA2603423.1 hypothetical protein [Microcystis sp. M26BS1]
MWAFQFENDADAAHIAKLGVIYQQVYNDLVENIQNNNNISQVFKEQTGAELSEVNFHYSTISTICCLLTILSHTFNSDNNFPVLVRSIQYGVEQAAYIINESEDLASTFKKMGIEFVSTSNMTRN